MQHKLFDQCFTKT